jgi:hypothetical protein
MTSPRSRAQANPQRASGRERNEGKGWMAAVVEDMQGISRKLFLMLLRVETGENRAPAGVPAAVWEKRIDRR